MSGAEEQLAKILGRFKDSRLAGVGPRDVDPTGTPGYVVLHKRCRCLIRSKIFVPSETGGNIHHHVIPIPQSLWRELSEERGWPQNRWTVS
ncbi:MAG: hypothetical protein V3S71_03150 [Acidobacteriota bacterium]